MRERALNWKWRLLLFKPLASSIRVENRDSSWEFCVLIIILSVMWVDAMSIVVALAILFHIVSRLRHKWHLLASLHQLLLLEIKNFFLHNQTEWQTVSGKPPATERQSLKSNKFIKMIFQKFILDSFYKRARNPTTQLQTLWWFAV